MVEAPATNPSEEVEEVTNLEESVEEEKQEIATQETELQGPVLRRYPFQDKELASRAGKKGDREGKSRGGKAGSREDKSRAGKIAPIPQDREYKVAGGKIGGKRVAEIMGHRWVSDRGFKGGMATLEKYGPVFYKEIGIVGRVIAQNRAYNEWKKTQPGLLAMLERADYIEQLRKRKKEQQESSAALEHADFLERMRARKKKQEDLAERIRIRKEREERQGG